jgi:hypothetical protein
MDETREEARDCIRARVWSGYYDAEEVFDIVLDEVLEADEDDEEWLRAEIRLEFKKKRKAEATWPAVTSCDRLDQTFEALRGRSVLTRHRCGLTMQDGLDVIELLYADEGGAESGLIGYCFYHLQDMEGAMSEEGGLWLAFGSFPPSRERAAEIGEVVQQEFERAGFSVQWDGTSESRLRLTGFKWQRRSPGG